MFEFVVLPAALFLCIWLPIETRNVRRGGTSKLFKGTREENLVRFRHLLKAIGILGLIAGILNLVMAVVGAGDPDRALSKLVPGVVFLVTGAVMLMSWRSLNSSPASSPTGEA